MASRGGRPFFVIGDPGRTARETADGPPPARIGPADVELSTGVLPGMAVRAASSRGLMHRGRRAVRQDAFALGRHAPDGRPARAIAAVCDGVGSLDLSDYAAALASRRLAEYGAAGMPWPDAFALVNEELAKAAATAEETGAGAMATTAVAVAVSRAGGDWVGEAARVGDSTLWHLGDDSEWTLLTDTGESDYDSDYHSSGVRSMPTPDGSCAACSFRVRGGALFAVTDGIGNLLRWSQETRAELARCWAGPCDPLAFAAQAGFAMKAHVDDRTAVGIWPDGDGEDAGQEDRPGEGDPAG
jgi:hypothetical protein